MRLLKHGFLVTLSVLALAAGGCDSGNFNMVVMFAIAPDDECGHPQQDTGPGSEVLTLPGGLIDVGHPIYADPDVVPNYYAWFQVHNFTQYNGNDDNGTINSRDVMMQTVELSYSWMRNDSLVAGAGYETLRSMEDEDVSLPMSGVVAAATAADSPGVLVAPVGLFPRYLGSGLTLLTDFADDPNNLSQLVLGVTVRFVGTTLGGTRVESFPMVFPINFCVGCLSGALCPDLVTPARSCIAGQDGYHAAYCTSGT